MCVRVKTFGNVQVCVYTGGVCECACVSKLSVTFRCVCIQAVCASVRACKNFR